MAKITPFFLYQQSEKSYSVKIYKTEKKTAAYVTNIVRKNTIKTVNCFNHMTDYK